MQIQSTQSSFSVLYNFTSLFGRKLNLAFLSLFCFLALAQPSLLGQSKHNPFSPEVRAAATQGIDFLRENMPSDVGESILAGIASIEYSKRYFDKLPVNDPLVENALEKALNAMEARASLPNKQKIYAPCLAVILFCTCDSEKYERQIKELLAAIKDRQNADGGFGYWGGEPTIGDTSQMQYVALAIWVAQSYGFDVPPTVGEACLNWLCKSQQPSGSWFYRIKEQNGTYPADGRTKHTRSIHCAGLGSVYLLGEYLGVTPNLDKNELANELVGLNLPISVALHVPGKENQQEADVEFDKSLLNATKQRGNQWLDQSWSIQTEEWNYYYLYALERYAYFRESSEDGVQEIPDWYDQGVEFLFNTQSRLGNWPKNGKIETEVVNTAFSIMFLVRASELLANETLNTTLAGHRGFPKPVQITGLSDIKRLLSADEFDLHDEETVLVAIKKSINEMAANDARSRTEVVAFLRGLLADQDPQRRKVAVKLLAGVQDIDNAPALIYALGDSEYSVRIEAHNGLRLISRKMDSIRLPDEPNQADFAAVKMRWTEWYLGINPAGKLLD